MVRNGYLPERELQTGLGPVTVQIPKSAKTGEAVTFRSALVPPYIRKTKSLEAAVPWLYLKGVSSGEIEARSSCRSPGARSVGEHGIAPEAGLGRGVPPKLRGAAGCKPLGVCLGDGIYSGLRAEQTKLCALVVIGVNERGEKRFLAIEDGVRESTQSWRGGLVEAEVGVG